VYFENNYVGQTYFDTRIVDDTLSVGLGRDNNIVVKRKQVNEFKEKTSISGNTKKVSRMYEIEVRNTRKSAIEIELEDQIPLTNNEQLEVEVLETGNAEYNKETGKLTWKLKLNPGESKSLRFGYAVKREGGVISLEGGGSLQATSIDVPADISSAAFFLVAASIAPGSDLLLTHVGINPTRTGVINILRLMGADISLRNEREVGGEPVADIRVRHAPLKGIEMPADQVPLAIDEFPALFIAAACAQGRTVLRGAEELRVKESDRIAAMAEGLATLGIRNEVLDDGIIIDGGNLGGGVIRTFHDHRIAMSFAIAALRAATAIRILDCDHVATSFPGFDALARGLGLQISAMTD
jgi:hypothetical protein